MSLPTDNDGGGRLDHLTVVADDGFGPDEVRALDRLREIKMDRRDDGAPPVRVMLTGFPERDGLDCGLLGSSREWRSATPFVVTRHLKKRGRKRDPVELWNAPELFVAQILREELARLCERRGWRDVNLDNVRIESLAESGVARLDGRRPIEFKRFRQKRGDDGGRRPCGAFRLLFDREVRGPICLGHSSHFGLGLFLPPKKTGK